MIMQSNSEGVKARRAMITQTLDSNEQGHALSAVARPAESQRLGAANGIVGQPWTCPRVSAPAYTCMHDIMTYGYICGLASC